MDIKERMSAAGISQVDMIHALAERGIMLDPPRMSQILNGLYPFRKAKIVLAECEKILEEKENEPVG